MRNLAIWLQRSRRFARDEDGPSAVEYAVMLALIVLVSFAAIGSVGRKMYDLYEIIDGSIPA